MDWLIRNPIADMYGPHFLLFYATVCGLTLIACRIAWRATDPTLSTLPPLVPPDPDAYELAYLRGGENELVRVVVLALIQRGYLQTSDHRRTWWRDSGEQAVWRAPKPPDPRHLTPLERSVFEWFDSPKSPTEMFAHAALRAHITPHCAPYRQRLEQERLLMPAEVQRASGINGLIGAVVILGLGGYKLAVALAKGRTNVGFLVLMGLLSLAILAVACRVPRLSHRGGEYLRRVQLAFERLKLGVTQRPLAVRDRTLLLLVGLFGVDVLAETSYDYYREMFRKAASHGGSCGTSCGSCGGGGGGAGGGGCGGCGGGGGE